MTDSDRRSALYASIDLAADLAAGVRSDQSALPTPCPDYDVMTLVSHLVGAAWRAVALGRGEQPSGGEFPVVALGDAPEELRRAGAAAASAWAGDAPLARVVTMPWGEQHTGAVLVDMYLAEITTHSFDLAAATGQLDRLDPSLAGPALDAAQSMMRPEYRDAMGPGSPFGPEVPAPPDATAWQRLAAFMGRAPRHWRAAAS